MVGALLSAPFWRPTTLPEPAEASQPVLVFGGLPVAAPPLPRGRSRLVAAPGRQVFEEVESPDSRSFPEPVAVETAPDPATPSSEQPFGSEAGSDVGEPGGDEGGLPGGLPGGIPGGDPEGCPGCEGGEGAVRDPDRPPRPIATPPPVYPSQAFAQKVEGLVVVEILIDARGLVTPRRILRSVPLLDRAALDCVRTWRFDPAVKGGRPVPTLATAPVRFRIF